MSWNGSDTRQPAGTDKKSDYRASSSPSSFNYKALIAGLVVVIGGGLAAYFILGRTKSGPEDGGRGATRPTAIADAKPQNVTHAVVEEKEQSKKGLPKTREEMLAWFEKRYGNNIPENLKSTVYFLKHPPVVTYRPDKRPEDIFKHLSERTIASVLMVEPGDFFLQKPVYDENFDRDFAKAIKDPTLTCKEDSEDEQELKKAVSDTMIELSERMRAGEKPSDILNAAMDTAYELGKYRKSLEDMVLEAQMDPSNTDKDVEDFVAAANKMLTAKGANEIAVPSMVRRQAHLRMLARKKQQKAQKEKSNETE